MKIRIALSLGLLSIAAVAQAGMPVDLPVQKPGLWQMTVTNSGMPGGARSFQICEDAAFVATARASSQAHMTKDCTAASSIRKVGDTWVSDLDCKISGMHVVSHTVTTVRGDSYFHTDMTSTMQMSKGPGKQTAMSMENKWMGPCKPGQKVGIPAPIR